MPNNHPVMHKFAIVVNENPDKTRIAVDNRELTTVTDFTLRAGANGYPNLIIGMTATGLIEGTAAIKFQVRDGIPPELETKLATLYDEVHATFEEELEEMPPCGKANIVFRLIAEVATLFSKE